MESGISFRLVCGGGLWDFLCGLLILGTVCEGLVVSKLNFKMCNLLGPGEVTPKRSKSFKKRADY